MGNTITGTKDKLRQEFDYALSQLTDDATWEDVVVELVREKKLHWILNEQEKAELHQALEDGEVAAVMARLHSSSSQKDDMRDTDVHYPDQWTTWAVGAGVVSFLPIPILSWALFAIAGVAGLIGTLKGEKKAWIGMVLAFLSFMVSALSSPVLAYLNKLAGL